MNLIAEKEPIEGALLRRWRQCDSARISSGRSRSGSAVDVVLHPRRRRQVPLRRRMGRVLERLSGRLQRQRRRSPERRRRGGGGGPLRAVQQLHRVRTATGKRAGSVQSRLWAATVSQPSHPSHPPADAARCRWHTRTAARGT